MVMVKVLDYPRRGHDALQIRERERGTQRVRHSHTHFFGSKGGQGTQLISVLDAGGVSMLGGETGYLGVNPPCLVLPDSVLTGIMHEDSPFP